MARKYSNLLLEMIEEGLLDRDTVITACVMYMSEDDVKDMMHANEMLLPEEEEECRYCGGDCPRDEEHACDGYLGNIDQLYEETENS
jgi:hypothetical protein